ncbi:MAG: hypothetical protein V8Q30_06130 [Acutalibacteraceae bacterium]
MELIGVRGGELCREHQVTDLILDGADEPGAVSRRGEQVLDEKDAGGLAVGAGDRRSSSMVCRASEEVGAEQRIGQAWVSSTRICR